ncbi:MAG: Rho termination factor N-terminal domain-containing protein [Patulibacter sp.]
MLQREALEASPLADLHELAAETGLEGYRRLRKADLIDRLLEAAGNGTANPSASPKAPAADGNGNGKTPAAGGAVQADDSEGDAPRGRRRRGGRGSRSGDDAPSTAEDAGTPPRQSDARDARDAERRAEGIVEVLANGTGFLRVKHPEQSDDDIYVSAAQVRRCELVSGDKIEGPYRAPRRSERFPSLVRVETINGRSAEEIAADGSKYDELPSLPPTQRFEFAGDDVTLKAIEWLAPIGRGSRVVIHGAAHAGKTEALRLLAGALKQIDGLELALVLAGARPEEQAAWTDELGLEVSSKALLGSGLEAQTQAAERAIEQAKRAAQRGTDAVVLIDSLSELAPHVARRLLAAARNLKDSGSVTIIATATTPVGGETTLIALDATRGGARFDLARSSTLKAELLVGADGAKAIEEAKAKA